MVLMCQEYTYLIINTGSGSKFCAMVVLCNLGQEENQLHKFNICEV